MRGETALWRAVITQALMDAASNSCKVESKFEKADALSWLRGNSKDFIRVCYFAGWDPDYVRSRIQRALHRGCKWRAEAVPCLRNKKPSPASQVKSITPVAAGTGAGTLFSTR